MNNLVSYISMFSLLKIEELGVENSSTNGNELGRCLTVSVHLALGNRYILFFLRIQAFCRALRKLKKVSKL